MDTIGFNPYAPPRAAVGDLETVREVVAPSEMVYVGFWRRFFAGWLDIAALLPLLAVTYYFEQQTRMSHLYWFVPGIVISLWFHVYLVERYGGTPGKILLKIRISMADGSRVTLKAAALRYVVPFALSALLSWAIVLSALGMTDDMYFSLSYFERSRKLAELAPTWHGTVLIALQVWLWSGFFTLLCNKKRRAVHDFMAGTVVIRWTPYV
jgi:uncharacterized RDD family membrane protein YckC